MRELWGVMVNEWIKLLHRRRFLITAILSLLVLGIYGVTEYHSHQNYIRYNNFGQNQQMQVQNIQQQIGQVNQSNDPNKNVVISNLRQQLSQIQASIQQNKELQGPNWQVAVQQQIHLQEQAMTSIKNNPATSVVQKMNNQFEINSEKLNIEQLQYNLNHHVRPLPIGVHNPYIETINFFNIGATIFFPMMMVILVSDMISGESTSGTIKLLLVRPVSRTKILLGKWLVSVFSAAVWTLLLCGALQVISMAVWGIDGSTQPVSTGVYYTFKRILDTSSNSMNGVGPQMIPIAHASHAVILPEWQFFLDATLLMVLAMVVVATIAFFFSALFKSAMTSTATAMGMIVLGFVITKLAVHSSWLRWIFSTHLDLAANWNGQLSMQMQQSITLNLGLLVLCIWGVLSLGASIWVFAKRDILNA